MPARRLGDVQLSAHTMGTGRTMWTRKNIPPVLRLTSSWGPHPMPTPELPELVLGGVGEEKEGCREGPRAAVDEGR